MISEFVRDHIFTVAWFGLMTVVWLGWGQEDPEPRWRWRLGAASVVGILLTLGFGVLMYRNLDAPTALAGRYDLFGWLCGAELVAAGGGCALLAVRRRHRWMAWWVAVVVAAHFIPLAMLLQDWTVGAVGVLQLAALAAVLPRLRRSVWPTSRLVGPLMGFSLLGYAVVAAAIYLFGTVT